MGIIKSIVENTEIKEYGKNVLEELASTIVSGDIMALGKLLIDIFNSPYFIREQIFWQNFIDYLDNAFESKADLMKLSEKLSEDGNSVENAKRIIKIIDDAGTKKKAIYVSNITRAYCMENITTNQFYKLAQCIVRLTDEDLEFLNEHISGKVIETDEEYIDDFRNCGLLKEVAGGFAYTKRAFELKKYSLWYGHEVLIPQIPERQMQANIGAISEAEIESLFDKIN